MGIYSKYELVQMVQRVMDCEDDEETIDSLIETLEENVPHPALSDLIYWPPDGKDLSAENIIDIALAYKWNEHQNKYYSKSMKKLVKNFDETNILNIKIEDILPKGFTVSAKPISFIDKTKDVILEVEKNTITFGDLFCGFERQLYAVRLLENWLKEIYPNKTFCSYFIYRENISSTFHFHVEYPNMDWISDTKVKLSKDCIRKNTF